MEKVQHGGSVAEVVGLPYMHRLPMEREVEQEVRASCTHGTASSVASRSFAADAPGQLHVLGHYGDPLRMEGAQVGVLEELNEMHLGSLLKREQRRRLKSHVLFHFLRNLANESLERRFSNEQVGRSLVPADLPQSHRSWAIAPFVRRRSRRRLSGRRAGRVLSSRRLCRRLPVLPWRLLDPGHGQRRR